jgi:hypothetical protein
MDIERIREWLRLVIGPTVDGYSDKRAIQKFRDIWDFYGSQILAKWNPPIPLDLVDSVV